MDLFILATTGVLLITNQAGGETMMKNADETSVLQGMFFRPRLRETGQMWDTWLYLLDETYYLYYLAKAGLNGTTSPWQPPRTASTGRSEAASCPWPKA